MAKRRAQRKVAQQLAWAFSGVAVVVALTCVALIVTLHLAGESLVSIRQDVAATRDGLGLALAVREQYIHEAHTIIVADASHVGHHDQWVGRVAQRAEALEGRVPASDAWRLERISATSQTIDTVFADEVVPAVAEPAGRERVQRAQARIHSLSETMASDADALVGALERRMVSSQASTHDAFAWALLVTALGVAVALLLAWLQLQRLRKSILVPLRGLAGRARASASDSATWPDAAAEITSLSNSLDRMRARLRLREDELVRRERAVVIGRLAAGVAEEIERPLSVIRERLTSLMAESSSAPWAEELSILDEEVSCCRRIVEDLLASAGAPRVASVRLQTRALVEDVVERLRRSHDELPQPVLRVEDVEVLGDPVWLRQVLTNLMENAAHAAPAETMQLRGTRVGQRFMFEVADRGPGIAEEDRDRVFEPFYSSRPGGTGLGLAVCSAVVRHHGGTLAVRSREGGGSVLSFDVPLAPME